METLNEYVGVIVAIVIIVLFFFLIIKVFKSEEDVGANIANKITQQLSFILESIMALLAVAEAWTAASIAAENTTHEISFAARLLSHGAMTLASIACGFAISHQVLQIFQVKGIWETTKQVGQALLVLGGLLYPIYANLDVMADIMNQTDLLFGEYSKTVLREGKKVRIVIDSGILSTAVKQRMDSTLLLAINIGILHMLMALIVGSISVDKIIKFNKKESEKKSKSDDKDDKKSEKDDDKKKGKEKEKPSIKSSIEIIAEAIEDETDVIDLSVVWNDALENSAHKDQLRARIRNLGGNIKRINDLISVKKGDKKAIEDLSLQKEKYKRDAKKFLIDLKK